jgi:hypothetical protein
MKRLLEDSFDISKPWTISNEENIRGQFRSIKIMDDFLLYGAAREALQDDTDDESVDDVEADEEDADFEIVDILLLDMLLSPTFDIQSIVTSEERRRRRKRPSYRCRMPIRIKEDGVTIVPLLPTDSVWYHNYVATTPTHPSRASSILPRSMRLSSGGSSLWAVDQPERCSGSSIKPHRTASPGQPPVSWSWLTFNDLKDNTGISPEVHRVFFHVFIYFGRTTLFDRYVVSPSTSADAEDHRHEFDLAGLPGCVGSLDATHVAIFRCPSQLRPSHAGWKQDLPSRTYNLTTNHRRRILHTTTGHPATYNDKTLVIYDQFAL